MRESALIIWPERTGSQSENNEIPAIPMAEQMMVVTELFKINIFLNYVTYPDIIYEKSRD